MGILTFAAIDIGSYNVAIEIFQISRKNGLKSLDYVDYRMELGRDTYAEGRISNAMVKELCQVLNDYKRIMEEYQVADYRVCATSALREAKNAQIVLGKIYQNTGIHLKDRKIENVILIGDYLPDILVNYAGEERVIRKEQFMDLYRKIIKKSPMELAMLLNVPLENATLMLPTAIIYRYFLDSLGADTIWAPGTQLTDGIAYDYAEKMKLIRSTHNFDNDIVMAARNIGKRYGVSKPHVQMVAKTALTIFDSMKKIHGLGPRERLLLECAVYLHDCGKYVSLSNSAECNYQIVMATEIIGLSHQEREMIAQITRFNTLPMESFESLSRHTDLGLEDYLVINKLTAILRLANAMDRSHLQKIEQMRAAVRGEQLILNLVTNRDYTLEQGLLKEKQEFFEDVFGIQPVLKVKWSI